MSGKFFKASIIGFSLFLLPAATFAAVSINEVMYDLPGTDTGREWVELFNSGPDAVSIATGSGNGSWRFVDGSAHTLTLGTGTNSIPANDFALIVKDMTGFMADYPSFVGTIFTSSISLTNSGSTLSLKDGSGNVLDTVVYTSSQGGSGDGATLQKQSDGSWIAAAPTPGEENSTTPAATSTSTSSDTSGDTVVSSGGAGSSSGGLSETVDATTISTHYSYLPLSDFAASQVLGVSAGRDRLAEAGGPVDFHAEASTTARVDYVWTFGDGSTGTGQDIVHRYEYPGQYIVVLNAHTTSASAVSRTSVTVVPAEVSVLTANDRYIEVKNDSDYELNLYGWQISADGHQFDFPRDTIIGAGGAVYFPADVTGLAPTTAVGVALALIDDSSDSERSLSGEAARQAAETDIRSKIDALEMRLSGLEAATLTTQ